MMLKLPSDRPEFANMAHFYAHELQPFLREHEADRKKALIRAAQVGGGGFIVVLIVMILGVKTMSAMHVLIPALAGAVPAFYIIDRTRKKISDGFFIRIAEELGCTYTQTPASPAAIDDFERLKFFGFFDKTRFEDEIRGTHAGTEFILYEARLEEKGHGDDSDIMRFDGQLLVIDYPRNFAGETVLRRERGLLNRLGKPGRAFSHVGLASPGFEKTYEAWSTDQMEARYLLDPVVLERFQALDAMFGGANLQAAFTGGKLLIALETGDRSSMGTMFSALEDKSRLELILKELDAIYDLIDVAVKRAKGRLSGPISVDELKSA